MRIPGLRALAGLLLAASALLVPACASRPPAEPAPQADDPYPGVNTVAADRDAWMQLLADHTRIRRALKFTPTGVRAVTESDDPAVAARIREHARAMAARMKTGADVRVWDPVFRDLFARHRLVTLAVTETERGVAIAESSDDPETVSLLWSHAAGVSAFVREGLAANSRPTPRIPTGSPTPPSELSIGGVPHRILLAQPDAAGLAHLRSTGVVSVINFRPASETPGFDESAAAPAAGLRYWAFPAYDPDDLTDESLDSVRSLLRDADARNEPVALHCRTGNRAGPAWIAWRVLDGHVPEDQAFREARATGALKPESEARAREYLDSRRSR